MSTYKNIIGKDVNFLTTDPDNDAAEGQVWYNSTDNAFKDLNASGLMGGSASGLMGRSQPQRRLLPDFVAPVKEPEKAGNGLFDIPILGQIIDTLDTARAGIVSGVKEVGDIFDSDNSFSVTEWYDQTKDNIMMGEVLRDWDVDLPGPLDFVVGLNLVVIHVQTVIATYSVDNIMSYFERLA